MNQTCGNLLYTLADIFLLLLFHFPTMSYKETVFFLNDLRTVKVWFDLDCAKISHFFIVHA